MAWSRSTSWDGGTCPSDPRPPRKPSRDAANARAAAHVMIAYNRGLYACSKRRCMNRALASNRMKIFAFLRPPATHLKGKDHELCPGVRSNEFGVGSFLDPSSFCECHPSRSAAPLLGSPLPFKVDTSVVSTASCRPLKRSRPSTTTSKRLLSPARGTPTSIWPPAPFFLRRKMEQEKVESTGLTCDTGPRQGPHAR